MSTNCLFHFSPLFLREAGNDHNCLLVIQCDSGHMNADLIACARYQIYNERVKATNREKLLGRYGATHVLFIVNLPHYISTSSFVGFQGDPWISTHIDDLRLSSEDGVEPLEAVTASISELFIGDYIHDIKSLMDTKFKYQQQISMVESEEQHPHEDPEESLKDDLAYKQGPETSLSKIFWDEDGEGTDKQAEETVRQSIELLESVEDDDLSQDDDDVKPKLDAVNVTTKLISDKEVSSADIPKSKMKPHTRGGRHLHVIAQCRRLHGCIQAAASMIIEDTSKDRSMQRVARLTKLIPQDPPQHLGKFILRTVMCYCIRSIIDKGGGGGLEMPICT